MRSTIVVGYGFAFAAISYVIHQELGGNPNLLGLGINLLVGILLASFWTRGAR